MTYCRRVSVPIREPLELWNEGRRNDGPVFIITCVVARLTFFLKPVKLVGCHVRIARHVAEVIAGSHTRPRHDGQLWGCFSRFVRFGFVWRDKEPTGSNNCCKICSSLAGESDIVVTCCGKTVLEDQKRQRRLNEGLESQTRNPVVPGREWTMEVTKLVVAVRAQTGSPRAPLPAEI